ncbi:hypothetical protein HMPREF1084_03377 [Clostridium butyricum 60E.3]|uniref:EpsG family protein n=1 Tax=Clostridium butyricum TaxID=1492 RepID=UPI0002D17B18|nr:EpsG family protein [Clostridium butyricum]ENZ30804.1 hypothetical protein HMPREF1084_03377 [Clostridium butyricum 60E.3]
MIIYFYSFFISMFFGFLAQKLRKYRMEINKKFNNVNLKIFQKKSLVYMIVCILSALPVVIVSSIRKNVGTDYAVYLPRYELCRDISISNYKDTNFDFGYFLFVKCIMRIFNNPQIVFAFTALIFIYCMWKFIFKFSLNIPISIYLLLVSGVFSYSLNIMRQMLCVAIFFNSLKYIREKKLIRFSIVILLSCFIHISAVIYLPLYFILDKKLSKKLLALIPVALFFNKQIKILIIYIVSNVPFLSEFSGYFFSMYDQGNVQTMLLILNLIVVISALLFDDFNYGLINEEEYKRCYIFYNLQTIALILSAFGFIIPNADRMVYMFMPVQLIYIPLLIMKSNKFRNISNIIFFLLYTIFFINYIGIKNYGQTLPYLTIFS